MSFSIPSAPPDSANDARGANPAANAAAPRRALKLIAAVRVWGDAQPVSAIFAPGNPNGIEFVNWCQDGARVFKDATTLDADVVLLDPTLPGFDAEDIQRLYHFEPKPIITIAAVPPQGDWGEKMYRMGVKGHIDLPIGDTQARALVAMIHTAVQDAWRHRSSAGYIPQIAAPVAQVIAAHGWERSVVAVWGAKGGIGKSTVAENLAALLGVIANRKTILLDANMAGGNTHLHLRIREELWKNNLFALASRFTLNTDTGFESPSVSALAARSSLLPHDVQGMLAPYKNHLAILMGLPKQHLAGQMCFQDAAGRAFVSTLLGLLRNMADFVVCDLGQDTNATVHLQILREVNYVFVIVNPDVASVASTGEVLDTLRGQVQLDPAKFRLVVNRFHPEHGLARKDISAFLQLSEIGVLPDGGPKVTAALNSGVPFVLNARGEMTRSLVAIASTLYPPITQIWQHRDKLVAKPAAPNLLERLAGNVLGSSR